MSASTFPGPAALRDELNAALGHKAYIYWETLGQFLKGQISRVEYDEYIRQAVYSPQLVQLHNQFIASILGSSLHHAPPTPPPDLPGKGKPPRKRRRTLPYQGDGMEPGVSDSGTLRSERIKRWTVGLGKKERERLKTFEAAAKAPGRRPRRDGDEIARERGLVLLAEGQSPPGTYPPVPLASISRAPTLQHITERVNLISAQNDLQPPSKTVSSLLTLACEAKLKQLITQALSLTSSSHAITSIQPTKPSHAQSRILTASSFDTLLTLRPAMLPNQSAAATHLISEGSGDADSRPFFDQELHFKERHTEDPRWQIFAMLAERSTVKEALLASR